MHCGELLWFHSVSDTADRRFPPLRPLLLTFSVFPPVFIVVLNLVPNELYGVVDDPAVSDPCSMRQSPAVVSPFAFS